MLLHPSQLLLRRPRRAMLLGLDRPNCNSLGQAGHTGGRPLVGGRWRGELPLMLLLPLRVLCIRGEFRRGTMQHPLVLLLLMLLLYSLLHLR